MTAQISASEKKGNGPERTIGLLAAINIIVGVIIGSGIFLTPGQVLGYSGSIGFALVVWAVSGIISLLGALCFAELGTVIPKSGGEYMYLLKTFSPHHKFWGQLPAFLCSWTYLLVLKPAACAVIILTCAQYSLEPFKASMNLDEDSMATVRTLLAVMLMFVITYINLVSTKLYLQINNLFTYGKLGACVLIIGVGIWQIAIGNTANLSAGFTGTTSKPGNIALAFFNGLWAYDGWSSVTILTEEIKKPEKNIVRAICIAVPITTALFVFMNMAYMTVLTQYEMTTAQAVAVEFGAKTLGPFAMIIPIGVALSTFGCVLSIQFGTTRICAVSGQEGHFMEPMSYLHVRRSTPAPAVALIGFISVLFILAGNVTVLVELASFLIWITYGTAMSCVIILRKTLPDVPRPFKVPIIIPFFTVSIAIFLAVIPMITNPSVRYVFALAFLAVGTLVYIPFVYKKKRSKFMNKLTFWIQVLFEVAPTQYSAVPTESD